MVPILSKFGFKIGRSAISSLKKRQFRRSTFDNANSLKGPQNPRNSSKNKRWRMAGAFKDTM